MDNLIEQTAECKIDLAGEVLLLGFWEATDHISNPNSDHNAWIKYILDEDLFLKSRLLPIRIVQEEKLLQQWTENCKMSLENCILDEIRSYTFIRMYRRNSSPPWSLYA